MFSHYKHCSGTSKERKLSGWKVGGIVLTSGRFFGGNVRTFVTVLKKTGLCQGLERLKYKSRQSVLPVVRWVPTEEDGSPIFDSITDCCEDRYTKHELRFTWSSYWNTFRRSRDSFRLGANIVHGCCVRRLEGSMSGRNWQVRVYARAREMKTKALAFPSKATNPFWIKTKD